MGNCTCVIDDASQGDATKDELCRKEIRLCGPKIERAAFCVIYILKSTNNCPAIGSALGKGNSEARQSFVALLRIDVTGVS